MINLNCLSLINPTVRDDRNIKDKKLLSKFIEDTYFNGRVENVVNGVSITRYDIMVNAKNIKYFLKLERNFNAFFDTNDVRLYQDGKYVCCEVPNKYRGTLCLQEGVKALESNEGKGINFYLGEKLDGTALIADITEMPHLLVAGQTGSGKSIFLHSLILSLLLQHSPNDLKFLMIDTKKVELSFYRGMPHIREVATTQARAFECLKGVCEEMDRRYEMFSEKKARDIDTYNATSEHKLPRLIVVVEELADLMLLSEDEEILDIVTRLVVKARACGIHVVLSTQRPESGFMTGKLKSNFQCRVAFATSSEIDSRIILGRYGAEKLKGKGDGIFRTNSGQEQIRFQSAMVTEREILDLVTFIKAENS